jgi:hypothetical protein
VQLREGAAATEAELTAEAWNQQIDAFDVPGLADQVASTGAKYLLFTIGQNSGHFCSPNATYDKIVGIAPSKCSRRDLVAELAQALKAKNVRLMVYLPSGAPAADLVARKKLGWLWGGQGGWQLPGEPIGGRLAEFQRHWEAVIREWSLRWGTNVSGWWVDGCYFADQMYRFDDEPNFASFARAMKAGNPESIVAFNPGVRIPVICHTKYDDYTAGEVNLPQLAKAVESCPGRWLECEGSKSQYHILSYLGASWCQGDRPAQPDDQVVALTRQLIDKGGAITFDVPIEKSGLIRESFLGQRNRCCAFTQKMPGLRNVGCFIGWADVEQVNDGTELPCKRDGIIDRLYGSRREIQRHENRLDPKKLRRSSRQGTGSLDWPGCSCGARGVFRDCFHSYLQDAGSAPVLPDSCEELHKSWDVLDQQKFHPRRI